ncbi:hypothetical protein BU23DRAFT_562644 [Bimuria novae-zelandiae CBS 107.79]|uniref:Mid2 domain-containing protein n=1 Tax=Bimuria novae-zelandiae CBS 107.79 TaxID=1447943 RepID=A0A6A5VZG8_9PLEO|nr:hypothetical protein BU23DRAFT_562644 [Bimuria novae-zelandiae CBS 107.79]
MSSQCYANNGSLYENTAATYVPCNLTAVQNGGHSACYNLGDLCMTNGLCMEPANEIKGANHYWRNGCTDPTFKDPACPNYCRGKGMNSAAHRKGHLKLVLQARIPAAAMMTILRSAPMRRNSSTSVPTTSQSPSRTSATADSATPIPTESSNLSSGMSSGAKAGLGVGITFGVLAVLAIVGAVFFIRRRRANTYADIALISDSKANPPPYVTYESAGTVRAELDGTMLPVEIHQFSDKTGSATIGGKEFGATTPTKDDSIIQKYS